MAFVDRMQDQQDGERKYQQTCGQPMRLRIFQPLDMLINSDGDDLGFIGDIAADHQHDAKLANGVRKAKNSGGQNTGFGNRQNHREKTVDRPRAQRICGLQNIRIDGFKGILQRLHHKRNRVKNRADEQPLEGKSQSTPAEQSGKLAQRAVRPHRQQ